MQETTPISIKAKRSGGVLKAAASQRFSQRQMLLLCKLDALAKLTASRPQSCIHSGSACTTSASNSAFFLQVQKQFAKLDYLKDRGMSVAIEVWIL
jgi:hypothetical protein